MNYDEQRSYLRGSRVWGAVVCAIFLGLAAACLWQTGDWRSRPHIVFALVAIAIACSMFYTPDYLHLTITAHKPQRWQVKIRWRIAGAVAILSLVAASTARDRITGLAAALVIAVTNIAAKKVQFGIRWIIDILTVAGAVQIARSDALITAILLAAAGHLFVAAVDDHVFANAALSFISSGVITLAEWNKTGIESSPFLLLLLLVFALPATVALGTAILVARAHDWHTKDRNTALAELTEYTHRSAEDVVRLWQTSNQQLAANWEAASLNEDDHEALKQWYAENSELYLFAISAYNLEYRRIKSNLFVLQYGRGHALDYGAGNGELVLEMARRGQRAAYYDVDGATLRFAKWRAERRGLAVEFFTDKESLAATKPFDTVFSFDVLEHIPDLAAELDYLAALLGPGGQMVFDLPTGATKAHPMHLEHRLDFRKFLNERGLHERKRVVDYLPFRRQEKFVFVK